MVAKWLNLSFTIYLAIAVIGAFSLSVMETFHFVESKFAESKNDLAGSSGFLTSISCTIDCLAENTETAGKTSKNSSSSLIFALNGNKNAEIYFSVSSLKTINENNNQIPVNTTPFKLRI